MDNGKCPLEKARYYVIPILWQSEKGKPTETLTISMVTGFWEGRK